MSLHVTPDSQEVVTLVRQAQQGRVCLPNFQRDFVWRREEVADLVRSILRGYFIGSLLLLRTDPQRPPFSPIFIRGATPEIVHPRPEFLILDGQQRLSSLLYALTAPDLSLKDSSKRRWFFVDLDALLGELDSDRIVLDCSQRELRGLLRSEVQYERRMLPCTTLLSQEAFFAWRDGFEAWAQDSAPDLFSRYRSEWRAPWTTAVTAFQNFRVPLLQLPQVDEEDGESIGRVCAIFEKLNSTGVELSVYDLLTARLYRSDIRLHHLWTEACHTHQRLRAWSRCKADHNKFGVLVLRTLALLRGLDPKPRLLIDLRPEGFEDDWRRAAKAMERAIELITNVGPDGFGVFDEKWLPGFALVPTLAALRAVIDDNRLGDKAREDLRRWYWCNVFMERYSSGVESKSRKDYAELTRYWLEGGPEPDVFAEARNLIGSPGFRIRGSASYASAVYSGVFCMLARRHARDWRLRESIELQELEDHHIFPRAYLTRKGVTKNTEINTIANRTLISDSTNRLIKDRAPAAYIADPSIFPGGATPSILDPHFLDREAVDRMLAAARDLDANCVATIYAEFLALREAAMIAQIRQACGISQPAAAIVEIVDEVAADAADAEAGLEDDEFEEQDKEP